MLPMPMLISNNQIKSDLEIIKIAVYNLILLY